MFFFCKNIFIIFVYYFLFSLESCANFYFFIISEKIFTNVDDDKKVKDAFSDNYLDQLACTNLLGKFYWKRLHLFHIVTSSPWPVFMGLCIFFLACSVSLYLHRFNFGFHLIEFSLFSIVLVMAYWFQDILEEGSTQGKHTSNVQRGLRIGICLFIVSEVMFFFSFFWAFFHSSLVPTVQIGTVWPPMDLMPLNAFSVPFANTVTLIYSGATVTYAHHSILAIQCKDYSTKKLTSSLTLNEFFDIVTSNWHKERDVMTGLSVTLICGVWFLFLQYLEYKHSHFDMSDSIYGSTFFITTGFHGFHVFVGFVWLSVCTWRLFLEIKGNLNLSNWGSWYFMKRNQHIGLEGAIWYWHFVDIVWIGLYFSVYLWGGSCPLKSATFMPKKLSENGAVGVFDNWNIPVGSFVDQSLDLIVDSNYVGWFF